MKKIVLNSGIFLLVISIIYGCTGNSPSLNSAENLTENPVVKKTDVKIGTETAMLLKDLQENGDYVNSQQFPSLIKASIVNENIGKNVLTVDIRPSSAYQKGHIKGAVNKKFEDLPVYFETGIKPFEFEKIIIVCDDGQLSSYTTCLLRLMGYGNVYAMRWGMSGWNKSFADDGWLKNLSGKYESNLDTTIHERPVAASMPELGTGKPTGEEIGKARFGKLFAEGTGNVQITADEVFADPSRFFIINLERKDKYEDGHIPGAFRYKPEATLGFVEEMASIPADKTVVVYCGTGHNSAFATAYLRFFGYDARTLRYGNNSFMYNKMVSEKTRLSWLPFTSADVNNFEVVR